MPPKKRAKMSKVDTQSILGGRIEFKNREFNFSDKQQQVLEKLLDPNTKIVFLSGCAGTSKTYMAIYAALHLLDRDYAKDIIYIRSLVESASRSLGYLPGDQEEKFSPFMMPLLDKCEEIISENSTKELTASNKLSSIPINFLRGASWRNKVVAVDEAQNLTHKELTTVLTRIGVNTKVFVMGDQLQSDINGKSGFADFIKAFDNPESVENGIHHFHFGKEDIFRSEILKFIVEKIEGISPPAHK